MMTIINANQKHKTSGRELIVRVAALMTGICGILYSLHLSSFFALPHYRSFFQQMRFSSADFAVFSGWLSAIGCCYYGLFLLLALSPALHSAQHRKNWLISASALRLTMVLMMMLPGGSFAFHFGWDAVPEVILLLHLTMLNNRHFSPKARLSALNTTVILGTLTELIPLVRNIQCITLPGMPLLLKLSFMLLPLCTMALFFTLGNCILRRRTRSAQHLTFSRAQCA